MTSRFCDDVFPPSRMSLVNEPQYAVKDPDYKKAVGDIQKWHRPNMWADNPSLFVENARPGDIQQNQLGDCWLLSAFSVVALHPGLLKKVFVSCDPLKGIYKVRLFHEGKWKIITVDDRIPCDGKGTPIFGHCTDLNELWVVILEKAIAKLLGTYECLDGGWMEEGIHMLTGGRCEKIKLGEYQRGNRVKGIPKEKLWSKLLKYDDERILMGCSITPGETKESRNEQLGLVAGHAYGILDCYETKDGQHKLIKIRNPWGQYEWKGKWSDRSNVWTLKYKKELNHVVSEDGIFWMSYLDFKKYFHEVIAVRIFNDEIMSLPSCVPISENEKVSFPNARWDRARMKGTWGDLNAGGTKSKRGFQMNSRIKMTLSCKCRTFMVLSRPQLTQSSESRYYGYNICFSIHKEGIDHSVIPEMVKSNNNSVMIGPDFSRYVGMELVLDAGTYVITPATDYPNRKGEYVFEAFASRGNITLTSLPGCEVDLMEIPATPRHEATDHLRIGKREYAKKQPRVQKGPSKSNFIKTELDKDHLHKKLKKYDYEEDEDEDEDEDEEKKEEEEEPKKKIGYQRFQSSYQMFFSGNSSGGFY